MQFCVKNIYCFELKIFAVLVSPQKYFNYYSDPDEDDGVLKHLPDCTTAELLRALDGALSLVHNNYGPEDSLTVANFTVKQVTLISITI